MSGPLSKPLAVGLVSLAALLGVAEALEWAAGAAALRKSDIAVAHGEVKCAIVLARRAAEASVPFSPYPQEGYARLMSIARDAEQRGDLEIAGFAWRAVRSAAMATQPASAAHGRVQQADEGLLRLMHDPSFSVTRSGEPSIVIDEFATNDTPSPWLPLWFDIGAFVLTGGLFIAVRGARARVPVA